MIKKDDFFQLINLDQNFVEEYVNIEKYHEFAGRSVKNEYDDKLEEDASTVDVDISVMLKTGKQSF